MAAIGNKVANKERRGDIISVKIDSLEDTQKVLTDSLVVLVNGIKEGKDDARKEASELKDMMRQLMNNSISNKNRSTPQTQQTVNGQQLIYGGTGTTQNVVVNDRIIPSSSGTGNEKRKHDAKTPSPNPIEKEPASPDHTKQRQNHSNEFDSPNLNNTVRQAIDFGRYDTDTYMGNIDDNSRMGHRDNNNNDTVMTRHGTDHHNAPPRIGYLGSSDSFASKDMNSDSTSTVLEEEQSITGHNFNNVIDAEMDYTTATVPITITTATTPDEGFIIIQNGSPTVS
jgi:hypothetical protein